MKLLFGPNVDSVNEIEKALDFSNEVVELSFTRTQKVFYDKDANELLKKFKYKSIHMPVLKDKEFISYPDSSISTELETIDNIINDIDPNTVLFHPDQIRDFSWVREKYGKRLAFENMDSRKNFGKTIEDMAEDIILEGIKSLDMPIVHEGDLLNNNLLTVEFEYVTKRMSSNTSTPGVELNINSIIA